MTMVIARNSRSTAAFMCGLLVVCVALGLVITQILQLDQRADSVEAEAFRRQAQLDSVAEDVRVLRTQLISVGQVPAAPDPSSRVPDVDELPMKDLDEGGAASPRPPSSAEIRSAVRSVLAGDSSLTETQIRQATAEYLLEHPPSDGDQGEPGRAPTAAELEIAVSTYCAGDACGGEQGPAGSDPTDEQIEAAVAMYCDSRGQCQGEPGRAPTDAELLEAISAYCEARDQCKGDAGDASHVPGPPGPPCPDEYVATEVEAWVTIEDQPRWVSAIACLVPGVDPPQGEDGR